MQEDVLQFTQLVCANTLSVSDPIRTDNVMSLGVDYCDENVERVYAKMSSALTELRAKLEAHGACTTGIDATNGHDGKFIMCFFANYEGNKYRVMLSCETLTVNLELD